MTLKPSTAFSGLFATSTFAAGAVNADALPTAALYRNGVLDAGVIVTVTNLATGIYSLTGTLGAYAAGDEVQLRATAVMSSLTFHEIVWNAGIDTSLASDVATAVAALNDFDPTADPVATVTNLTNAPTNGDFTAVMKTSVTSAVPTALQNADALLDRDMSAVAETNARSPLNALRFLRNKWSVAGGTLTVTKENDVTSAWTATVSTDAAAIPIIGNDPA